MIMKHLAFTFELSKIVKSLDIVACFPSNWVCIAPTPDKYPNSVEVTSLTTTFPLPLLTNALLSVKST